ncbi:MAG: leucine-rich repeat protein [Oscillospiraceae bacterium]|nr:leucine-rich repeat protein [Oscillospiraceae bacterium]
MRHSIWRNAASLTLALCMALGMLCAAEPAARAVNPSGTIDALSWSLDAEGVLTITGKGAIPDYKGKATPWNAYKDDILEIVIGDGVTGIGGYAFKSCAALTHATIADSVKEIGDHAFESCPAFKKVTGAGGVESIGGNAFADCGLRSITLPACLKSLGTAVYNKCDIVDVYYGGTAETWKEVEDKGGSNTGKLTYSGVTWHYNYARGVCGENLIWEYCDGVLTVRGEGEMNSYGSKTPPWHDRRSDIKTVVIESYRLANSNVTSIGDSAFRNCSAVSRVMLPESITRVGAYAFPAKTKPIEVYYAGAESQRDRKITFGQYNGLKNGTWHYNYHYAEGTCGDALKWRLDGDRLDIWGKGKMTDWESSGSTPWQSFRDYIQTLAIAEGVTTVGKYANFVSCSKLNCAILPESLKTVEAWAFGPNIRRAPLDVYYAGSSGNAKVGVDILGNNDFLTGAYAVWYYRSRGPASLDGSFDPSANELTYRVTNAPENALLIAVRYDNGRMTDVQALAVIGNVKGSLAMRGTGEDCRLMLLNKTTFAPLCPRHCAAVG